MECCYPKWGTPTALSISVKIETKLCKQVNLNGKATKKINFQVPVLVLWFKYWFICITHVHKKRMFILRCKLYENTRKDRFYIFRASTNPFYKQFTKINFWTPPSRSGNSLVMKFLYHMTVFNQYITFAKESNLYNIGQQWFRLMSHKS